MPCGSLPTGIVATCEKSSVRKTLISSRPPTVRRQTSVGIAHDVDVIGERTGVRVLSSAKGGLASNTGLTGVFEREPHLAAVRRRRKIGAERARLGDPATMVA